MTLDQNTLLQYARELTYAELEKGASLFKQLAAPVATHAGIGAAMGGVAGAASNGAPGESGVQRTLKGALGGAMGGALMGGVSHSISGAYGVRGAMQAQHAHVAAGVGGVVGAVSTRPEQQKAASGGAIADAAFNAMRAARGMGKGARPIATDAFKARTTFPRGGGAAAPGAPAAPAMPAAPAWHNQPSGLKTPAILNHAGGADITKGHLAAGGTAVGVGATGIGYALGSSGQQKTAADLYAARCAELEKEAYGKLIGGARRAVDFAKGMVGKAAPAAGAAAPGVSSPVSRAMETVHGDAAAGLKTPWHQKTIGNTRATYGHAALGAVGLTAGGAGGFAAGQPRAQQDPNAQYQAMQV